ncbi:MAG: endonuclease/exonuclease/phosphatase family protein [Myxococcota bacterium]
MSEVRVMSWNVRYFGHGSNGLRASDAWMRRMAWVFAAQPELPDVVALQEVEAGSLRGGQQPQLDRFVALLDEALAAQHRAERFTGLYFPAHRYAVGERALMTTGLAVLVRDSLEVGEVQAAEITHVRLAINRFKQRRIAARVQLAPKGGGPGFDLVNTHLSLPAFLEVGPHRVPHRMGYGSNQLREIDNLLDFVGRPARPTVVAGDFNSRPGSPAYARMVEAGFVDPYAAGRTPEEHEAVGTAGFLHLRMHIDHLFSTPGLVWPSIEAHSVDGGPFQGLSDHAPKTGVLALAA